MCLLSLVWAQLNDLSSSSYNNFLKNMDQRLATITTGINDLPSNISKSLPDIGTTPSDTPKQPLPNSASRVAVLPNLDRKDFPNVVHWDQGHYNSLRKGCKPEDNNEGVPTPEASTSSSSSGGKVSVISCFMEDEHGRPISEAQKTSARAKAKHFWNGLFDDGVAPLSFCKLDVNTREAYIALMEDSFPWLRLCENHWKSEKIWHNHYSDWLKKRVAGKEKKEKKKAAKAAVGEVIDVDADASNNSQVGPERPSKRPQADGETNKPKRRRVEVESPLPSPHPAPAKITTNRLRVCSFILSDYILH